AVAPPLVHASIAVVTAAAIALLPHASLSPPTLSLPRRRCQPAPAAPRGPARQICPDPSPAAPHPPAPRVPPSPRSRGEGWGEGPFTSATATDQPLPHYRGITSSVSIFWLSRTTRRSMKREGWLVRSMRSSERPAAKSLTPAVC